ncbi:glycosyltransferase involved in cell wall biosynthesis [Mycetocola sp. CAN_C7]|uniref:glycosyltransferase family 4 protein n=1 Tax=Mycetocola sp. CAN_C7 TaxID=2787724 RepID=UPI0018CAB2EC
MGAAVGSNRRSGTLSVLYSFPGAFGGPGFGAIAWHQVDELVRAGHEVTLVAASVARPMPGIRSIVRSLDLVGRGIPERTIGRARAYAWHDFRARRVLAAGEFDIVHTWPLAAARTLELANRIGVTGIREAPTTHLTNACTVVSREYARLGLAIPSAWAKFGEGDRIELEEREYAAATALLVPSDAVERSFLARGYEQNRLIRHQYGFDPANIRVPVREANHPFTAVFVGRGVPRKGLHYALEAWLASRASATGRLLIYGAFDPDYRELLRASLAHPSVTVCGPTEKPGAAYAKADVLLLPSVEEGSALVTYEAQGAGVIPLVSSASGAVVEHGVNGLVHDPGDVATLTAHIELLFDQEKARRQLRSAALAEAQLLTWSVAGRVLVKAYRIAMDRPVDGYYGQPSEQLSSTWGSDAAVS